MTSTQEQIVKVEEKLKTLKEKLKKESDKSEWIDIPELNIQVQTKIHHKDKTYAECEKDLAKGELIPTYEQIQWLRNSKYKDQLELEDTWEFVQNPDNISKENGYVAGFCAYSDFVCLGCGGVASVSVSGLGVRFVRKKVKGKKAK